MNVASFNFDHDKNIKKLGFPEYIKGMIVYNPPL